MVSVVPGRAFTIERENIEKALQEKLQESEVSTF